MTLTADEQKILAPYLDQAGRVQQWAAKPAARKLTLKYLASKFEFERHYTEREVNEVLKSWHTFGDHALLRRELFESGYLNREPNGASYWRTNTTFL